MVGHGGSSAGSYLADPTSPIPSHCASIVATALTELMRCCETTIVMFLQKLYAVCDLALHLVMTKTSSFVLKDFPAEPVLPAKLFTQADQVSWQMILTAHKKPLSTR